YKPYLDKYWRPDQMDMLNHQTGKSTELLWQNYTFGNGLNDADFNKNSLKRAR
ncbi:MAG: outer membrane lipoprotein-sorting protein, partial [Sedimenticola thiotaurini]